MQSDHKEIYRLTSQRTGKSEQLYKDIGNLVFTELSTMLRKPKSLIVKLKGVGSWRLRKKRMEIVVEDYADGIVDQYTSPETLQIFADRRERYEMFLERLKEYNEYISIRKETKVRRNEHTILLETDKGQNPSTESS